MDTSLPFKNAVFFPLITSFEIFSENLAIVGEKTFSLIRESATLIIPFIILKSRKFVALYTMGSVTFTLGSFSLLWGPYHHLKHLLSLERLPFTTMYFGSIFTTLYVAIFIKSMFLILICAIIQVITLTWYIISYLPGGTAGMKIMSRFFSNVTIKTVSKTLPV